MSFYWSRETYQASVSSRCWDYTPYNDGWDACPGISADRELAGVVRMELELAPVPDWARTIAETSINFAPPCGQYRFPKGFLEVLDAIGSQTPPALVHSCFTVDPARKREAMDYCFLLDAWLADAAPEAAARELDALGQRKIAWDAVCRDLWQVLSVRTELKELHVARLLHQVRNATKSSIWDGDFASQFIRDQYTGDYVATGGPGGLQQPPSRGSGFPRGRFPSRSEDRRPDRRTHRRPALDRGLGLVAVRPEGLPLSRKAPLGHRRRPHPWAR